MVKDGESAHPNRVLLEEFMRGELAGAGRLRIVRHLLSGCPSCSAVTRRFWALADGFVDKTDAELSQLYRRGQGEKAAATETEAFLRQHWQTGNSAADAAALLAVRQGFLAVGQGLAAAQVSLDLAVLYAKTERWEELGGLVEGIFPILCTRDLRQEAMATLLVFRRAVETESASVELLVELGRFLMGSRRCA